MNKNNIKNKKAISFTLDAFLVVLIAAAFIFVLFRSMSAGPLNIEKSSTWGIGADTLGVFEMNGDFEELMSGNKTNDFQMKLEWLYPESVCAKIIIYDKDGTRVQNVSMACWNESEERNVIYRTIVYNGNPYYAKMETWINE
jgi:hypothetical protein